ncbi:MULTISPECIES: electron transfer flavoprotein subunit beta/FixA family protein [Micrococcaceae]|uniref:electron transfer flavoprotein subunit beta/FixA family protein n=1 Tax=Micrococcaceae TaxID=1268 RepID=UPI000CFB9A79|nr:MULTISPECIES: electron transfer flavoprotein subunit beta/FixA family protein [unclassified Arthrobacter]MCS3493758.1 electron transfer flavoprotein beta subunit [Arthrobacter sp. JUb119]PQZ89720.1 electron transfer flavoprotein subunit beta [Arthrobacter sp. MYb222]PRB75238.1 electron transfer flavoprotein subunit beta [Arthrobacter sp. MYb214]
MKIAVLIKEVPDTGEDRLLDLETGLADRAASEVVLDEIGERTLEVALKHADANPGTEITVLTMGPDSAQATLRKGLAMGAASAVHISDEELLGADLVLTAQVLAAALRRGSYDLVLTGNMSTDGSAGMLPVMLAELLDLPAATSLSSVEIADGAISGLRELDGAAAQISAPLPAVASITEALPDARFPNFKGIMAAKKKPVESLSLADLGVESLPADTARSIMVSVAQRPPRTAGTVIADDGDAGNAVAEFLVKNNLV